MWRRLLWPTLYNQRATQRWWLKLNGMTVHRGIQNLFPGTYPADGVLKPNHFIFASYPFEFDPENFTVLG